MNLYTIGYTGAKVEALHQFAEVRKLVIIDTRFQPRSRVARWNKGPLQAALGDRYVHIGAFGNLNYKNGGPIEIQDIGMGIAQVERILQRCDGILLMCVCEDVETCHRKVVSSVLEQHFGVTAIHLSPRDLENTTVPLNDTQLPLL